MKITGFSKTDNNILRLLKVLLGACLFTPLLASASFIFPYTAPKAFVFRILIEIAAVFYFYLALKYPALRLGSLFCHPGLPPRLAVFGEAGDPGSRIEGPGCRIKSGMTIGVAVLVFLAINFLSAIFGADFYTSWWGNLERMGGVWGLLHFAAFFIMAGAVFKEENDWRLLVKISVAVGVIVGMTALVQRLGGMGDLLPSVDRIFGTTGNAGFFAGYMVFNIFLAGYLLLGSAGWKKWLFAVCALLLAIGLLLSGTRGAYLGLAAGIIAFLTLMVFVFTLDVIPAKAGIQVKSGSGSRVSPSLKAADGQSKPGMTKRKKQVAVSLLVLIFILAGSLFLLRNSALVKNNPVLSRLTAFSLSDATAQSRILVWRQSWRAWQERPLLGWGPENFGVAADKYFDARLAGYEAYSFDRAHNFIFDYGVTTGWLGLAGYLGLFGAAGWTIWRMRKNNFMFFALFTSLLAAYSVQNFFIFDSFVSYLMLFFILAMMNSRYQEYFLFCHSRPPRLGEDGESGDPGPGSRVLPPLKDSARIGKPGMTVKISLALFAVLIVFSLYSSNLKPLLASYRANQLLSLSAENTAQEAVPLLKDALDLGAFGSAEIAYQAALDYIDKITLDPALAQNEDFYDIAAAGLARSIERSPDRARNYIALAWLDLYFSGRKAQRIDDALVLGEKARGLSPIKKDAYLILVAGYSLSGQPAKAQEMVSQAEKIDAKMGEEVKNYYEKLK